MTTILATARIKTGKRKDIVKLLMGPPDTHNPAGWFQLCLNRFSGRRITDSAYLSSDKGAAGAADFLTCGMA
jgi:hypothetical protein